MAQPIALRQLKTPNLAGAPLVLAIMDGVGLGAGDAGDAVAKAHTPVLDALARLPFTTRLAAHGTAVGLAQDADMGNSEVGHNAMGAGRVFDQGAKLVAQAIHSQAVFAAPVWAKMVARCSRGGALHLIGLLSDGNIHSHIDHLLALVARAHAQGVQRLRVHALLDGRDVARASAHLYIARLEHVLAQINHTGERDYVIASGGGRMRITMDRYEADWAMVQRGYALHVRGEGPKFSDALTALAAMRDAEPGIGDQDLPGFVVAKAGQALGPVRPGDAMIAVNFRGDRMLEWVRVMEDEAFTAFDRGPVPQVLFAGMTLYDGDTQRPHHYLVPPPQIEHTLGELMADAGIPQIACSETQKFGHVTYFWNGNKSGAFDPRTERYIEVPSLSVPFAQAPAMQAEAIVTAVTAAMQAAPASFVRLNFANGDMVGHTGNFAATVQAIEAVDRALGRLQTHVRALGGALMVTADHGNAEDMAERDPATGVLRRDDAGQLLPKTRHSTNPVPFYLDLPAPLVAHARLAAHAAPQARPRLTHVAATCANLLGYAAPEGHFDPSLITWAKP